jgi:hypothetical protein
VDGAIIEPWFGVELVVVIGYGAVFVLVEPVEAMPPGERRGHRTLVRHRVRRGHRPLVRHRTRRGHRFAGDAGPRCDHGTRRRPRPRRTRRGDDAGSAARSSNPSRVLVPIEPIEPMLPGERRDQRTRRFPRAHRPHRAAASG